MTVSIFVTMPITGALRVLNWHKILKFFRGRFGLLAAAYCLDFYCDDLQMSSNIVHSDYTF